MAIRELLPQSIPGREGKQRMVSSGPHAGLKRARKSSGPPPSSSSSQTPHLEPWEKSAVVPPSLSPLQGRKGQQKKRLLLFAGVQWPLCVRLCFPPGLHSPSLFLPNFYKHTVMPGLTSQILEISEWVWPTWFMCSMKAWLPGRNTFLERGREGRGSRGESEV